MARKLANAPAAATSPAAQDADDPKNDLAVLHPDFELTIDGRKLTIHEPNFEKGQAIRAKWHPLIRDLSAVIQSQEALTEDVRDVLARHDPLVRELIALTTDGADAEWITTLDDTNGDLLLMAWWGVLGPFFIRSIRRRVLEPLAIKALREAASGGPTSSTSSPSPATATPSPSSVATPSVN